METLFKFALVRSPIDQSAETPSIQLAQDTTFQQQLERLRETPAAREQRRAIARAFVSGEDFVKGLAGLTHGTAAEAFGKELELLVADDASARVGVVAAAKRVFGAEPSAVVTSDAFNADLRRLRDTIIAIKLLPEEHFRPIHRLSQVLRDLEIVRRVADDESFPRSVGELRKWRKRSILLEIGSRAAGVVNRSLLAKARRDQRREDDEERRKEVERNVVRLRNLVSAVNELTSVSADSFTRSPLRATVEALPPGAIRPLALFERRLEASVPVRGDRLTEATVVPAGASAKRGALPGRLALRVEDLSTAGFKMTDKAISTLMPTTRETLKEARIELAAEPLDHAVDSLRLQARQVNATLERLAAPIVKRTLKRFGGGARNHQDARDLVLGGHCNRQRPRSCVPVAVAVIS